MPKLVPVPFGPVHHSICEPAPAVPPLAVKVAVEFGQIVEEGPDNRGAVDAVLMVTGTETHAVVLQLPAKRTKYVVFTVGETGNELPVPITALPQDPSNHSAIPLVPAEPPCKVSVVL